MSDLLTLRRRLQNIHSVHEITDAMQIIATITIGHAQKLLNYRRKVQSLHDRLFITRNQDKRKVENEDEWVIAFFSEKGFCGNYNPQLLPSLNKHKTAKNIIIVGARGRAYAERIGIKNAHYFGGAKKLPVESVTEGVFNLLKENGFPKNIKVIFNKYNNMFFQVPKALNFFPDHEDVYKEMNAITDVADEYLDALILERYVRAKLFYFFAQDYTGETASKLLMMKNATESADKLQGEITKEVYKVRQMRITQDLSEVISAYKVLQMQKERR